MEKVFVIGAGFMGSGIAQVCAQAGYEVILADLKPEALDKALASMEWSLGKLAAKGFITEDPSAVLARVSRANGPEAAAGADWVIESVFEIETLKRDVFKELDRITPDGTPLASNTSSIPITRLARGLEKPERVLGLHFFGPVPFMGVVEVVKGEETSEEVFSRGADFVRTLGKTPIRVRRDIPMFVLNRIFSAAFSEALDLVAEGVVTPEDADLGMRLGYGWNVGPFEIADNAGLDTYDLIVKAMALLGEERLSPGPGLALIEKMVKDGRLGRKAGKGFYKYTEDGKRRPWNNNE